MDSQSGAVAAGLQAAGPVGLQVQVQARPPGILRELLISSSDVGARDHQPASSSSQAMGVPPPAPLPFAKVLGSSQKPPAAPKGAAGKPDLTSSTGFSNSSSGRTQSDESHRDHVFDSATNTMSASSDILSTRMNDVGLDSAADSAESERLAPPCTDSPSTLADDSHSGAPMVVSIPPSSPVIEADSLCNRTREGAACPDLGRGSCDAMEATDLAISGAHDAIRLDTESVEQRGERTPGDGEETPDSATAVQSGGGRSVSSPVVPGLGLDDSDGESIGGQPAVLDVTSSEELVLSEIELSGEGGPVSPATIDVISLDAKFVMGAKLRRPRSLEGLMELESGAHNKWATPNRPQSLRTTPCTSTPRFLEDLPSSEVVVLEELQGLPSSERDTRFDPKDQQQHRLSGILQHELRSRASFASVSSQSTDYSSSLATDDQSESRDPLEPGFVEVNLHSQLSGGDHWAYSAQGAKPKKRGLAGFLARNLFPWKSSGKSAVDQADGPSSSGGWKLFNRGPAKQASPAAGKLDDHPYPPKGKTHPPTQSLTWKKKQAGMRPATSTTALILENRPQHLPAKNPDEEQKHKEQYEIMIKGAKQKEIKVYKQQMKKLAKQLKYEESIKTLLHVWQTDILKSWDNSKSTKKTREMWWQGIPPSIRGRVWLLAIGNELNITPELFEIFLARAKDRIKVFSEPDTEDSEEVHEASREDSVDVIRLDVSRTFPHLCIYQKGGPYFDRLHSVLGAYACYRPDIGYVQGMSFIAAVFLLYLEPADAFCCFANVLNKSCQLAFFRLDQPVMQSYFDTYEEYFEDNLPDLYQHFKSQCLTPDLYIIDWMYTLYTKSLPLDVACRFLDIFFRDGEEFIFRTALGILHLYEEILISLEFIQLAQYLTKLPEDIQCEALFRSIEAIDLHQKKFSQVLAAHLTNSSGHA